MYECVMWWKNFFHVISEITKRHFWLSIHTLIFLSRPLLMDLLTLSSLFCYPYPLIMKKTWLPNLISVSENSKAITAWKYLTYIYHWNRILKNNTENAVYKKHYIIIHFAKYSKIKKKFHLKFLVYVPEIKLDIYSIIFNFKSKYKYGKRPSIWVVLIS